MPRSVFTRAWRRGSLLRSPVLNMVRIVARRRFYSRTGNRDLSLPALGGAVGGARRGSTHPPTASSRAMPFCAAKEAAIDLALLSCSRGGRRRRAEVAGGSGFLSSSGFSRSPPPPPLAAAAPSPFRSPRAYQRLICNMTQHLITRHYVRGLARSAVKGPEHKRRYQTLLV